MQRQQNAGRRRLCRKVHPLPLPLRAPMRWQAQASLLLRMVRQVQLPQPSAMVAHLLPLPRARPHDDGGALRDS
jgi:hypothetical protein